MKILLLLCAAASLAENVITPEKIKNIEDRLRATEKTLEELKRENEVLRKVTQASEKKIESFQAGDTAQKVAFSAGLSASGSQHTGPVNDQRVTLAYQKIFTNTGNAYDSNTGIFTAPVKGVYFFRFYAHSQGGNPMGVSLYKNNHIQCSVYSHMPVTNANASNAVILTLEKGDQVYTQLRENSLVFDDNQSYTSFSGFLIFPLQMSDSSAYPI